MPIIDGRSLLKYLIIHDIKKAIFSPFELGMLVQFDKAGATLVDQSSKVFRFKSQLANLALLQLNLR